MHRFLLGYNVETSERERPGVVGGFLQVVGRLHREMEIPCTFFIRGETLAEHVEAFRRIRDECGELVDFQQCTYSGTPLKTVCQENHDGLKVMRGASVQEIADDVSRTSDLMERLLGGRPRGLGGPLGYYRGLSDRPDILEAVRDLGIRFTRTYTRNARDWSPVGFEVQPFRYAAQGFEEILEIPGQGWPDHVLKHALGSAPADRCVRHVRKDLDYVAAKELTWSYVHQDRSAVAGDPEMTATRAILEYAQELGFTFRTHRAYCDEHGQSAAPDEVASEGPSPSPPA